MPKRKTNETSSFIRKKSCDRFKMEWLSELIGTEIPASIYIYI
jgi:hypothetical protein